MTAAAEPWLLASWTLEVEGRAAAALEELDRRVAELMAGLEDKAARHKVLSTQLQVQLLVRALPDPEAWELELDAGEQRGQDGSLAEWYHFTLGRAPLPPHRRRKRGGRW